jgi:hypothetical protein
LTKPKWHKFLVKDEQFLLPDGIKRHQLAIQRIGTRLHMLVIGGQRTFNTSEARHLLKEQSSGLSIKIDQYKPPQLIFAIDVTSIITDFNESQVKTIRYQINHKNVRNNFTEIDSHKTVSFGDVIYMFGGFANENTLLSNVYKIT